MILNADYAALAAPQPQAGRASRSLKGKCSMWRGFESELCNVPNHTSIEMMRLRSRSALLNGICRLPRAALYATPIANSG